MIKTSMGTLQEYNGKALVFFLGVPESEPEKAPAARVDVPTFSEEEMRAARQTPSELFRGGVHFVISPQALEQHAARVRDMQKWATFVYYKYFFYPARALDIPDQHQVRKGTSFNLLQHLRAAENMPLFLRFPIADRLADVARGLPALLLLPGPSLQKLGPHLPELAKRFVLVTLSRCLHFCQEHGAMPDFMAQLDGNSMQGLFFPDSVDLSEVSLVSLSVAPVAEVAERFKTCFFMETFDITVLPKAFRLRESWLSSIFPCFGITEVLGCDTVILAGAELSFPPNGGVYYTADASAGSSVTVCEEPTLDSRKQYIQLQNRRGEARHTTFAYYATAGELEGLLAELASEKDMAFRVLEDEGILSPELAPAIALQELLAFPEIDKQALRQGIARVGHGEADMNLLRLKMNLLQQLQGVKRQRLLLSQVPPEQLQGLTEHPLVESLTKISKSNRIPRVDEASWREILDDMLLHWETRLRAGEAWTLLALHLQKMRDIPVLTERHEKGDFAVLAKKELPKAKLRFYVLDESAPEDASHVVDYASLLEWLGARLLVLASPQARGAVRRILPWKNFPQMLSLEEAARLYRARMPGEG